MVRLTLLLVAVCACVSIGWGQNETANTIDVSVARAQALQDKVSEIGHLVTRLSEVGIQQGAIIQQLQADANFSVAFNALYKYSDSFVTNDVLKFGKVTLNVGDAYDGNTGRFTAPRAGIYNFKITVNFPYGGSVGVNLISNNSIVAALYAYDKTYDHGGSMSATVRLGQGEVFMPVIRDVTGRKHFDNDPEYTVLNGHLIHLD